MAKTNVSRTTAPRHKNKSTSIRTVTPIPADLTHLFRPNTSFDTPECLPFVKSRPRGQGRDFWCVPDCDNYEEACQVGTLYAAAALIYCKRQPDCDMHVVRWAIFDMIQKGEPNFRNAGKGYIVGFMEFIERVARAGLSGYTDEDIYQIAAYKIARSTAAMASLPKN